MMYYLNNACVIAFVACVVCSQQTEPVVEIEPRTEEPLAPVDDTPAPVRHGQVKFGQFTPMSAVYSRNEQIPCPAEGCGLVRGFTRGQCHNA